jgi:hypothetical protein
MDSVNSNNLMNRSLEIHYHRFPIGIMKNLNLSLHAAAVLLMQQVGAHYVFNRLIVNSTISQEFQYVRDVMGNAGTRDSNWLKSFPVFGVQNPDIVCGRGSFPVNNSATIETATVLAGSEVGFMVSEPFFEGDSIQYIYHDGPGQMFLSKLPEGLHDLNDYDPSNGNDGSGGFFKIGFAGPINATSWFLQDKFAMMATIPATTPPGLYILRIEQFLPSSTYGESQWFINCAHLQIVGTGGGTPGPLIRFPAYSDDDPSIWFREEGTASGFPKDAMKYIQPKPDVWHG